MLSSKEIQLIEDSKTDLKNMLGFCFWQSRQHPGISLEDISLIIKKELAPEEVATLIRLCQK